MSTIRPSSTQPPPPTVAQNTTKTNRVDEVIDFMRQHKLPPLIDLVLSYIVLVVFIVYYAILYYQLRSNLWKYYIRRILLFRSVPSSIVSSITSSVLANVDDYYMAVPLTIEPKTQLLLSTNTIDLSYINALYNTIEQIANEFYEEYKKIKKIQKVQLSKYNTDEDTDGTDDENTTNSSYPISFERQPTPPIRNTLGNNEKFIYIIRNDLYLRRVVSKFVTYYRKLQSSIEQYHKDHPDTNNDNNTIIEIRYSIQILYHKLQSVWIELLRMPSLEEEQNENKYQYQISVIIPAYKERGEKIAALLYSAQCCCTNPSVIQLIIVHADNTCPDLLSYVHDTTTTESHSSSNKEFKYHVVDHHQNHHPKPTSLVQTDWGEVRIISYNGGGGRGPCLNAGAAVATGKVLTFVHSDTILPQQWDKKILSKLFPEPSRWDILRRSSSSTKRICHACTFRYSIDTSKFGLDGLEYPWGVHSVTLLGRLRARLCRLPYGDHVISIPTEYFQYVGGYPNQSLMEDYDLMDVLRQRSLVVPLQESLSIISGSPVVCSPRRWQKYGVTYVTIVNAILVHRYAHGKLLAQDAFDYYYVRPQQQQQQQQQDEARKKQA